MENVGNLNIPRTCFEQLGQREGKHVKQKLEILRVYVYSLNKKHICFTKNLGRTAQ